MAKKVTLLGEIFGGFADVGKEMGRQISGRKEKKGGGSGSSSGSCSYHHKTVNVFKNARPFNGYNSQKPYRSKKKAPSFWF